MRVRGGRGRQQQRRLRRVVTEDQAKKAGIEPYAASVPWLRFPNLRRLLSPGWGCIRQLRRHSKAAHLGDSHRGARIDLKKHAFYGHHIWAVLLN